MPLVSVRAVFEHGEVKLLEEPPVHDRYEVLVTFLAPENETKPAEDERTLRDLRGIWSHIEFSMEDIQASEYKLPEDRL